MKVSNQSTDGYAVSVELTAAEAQELIDFIRKPPVLQSATIAYLWQAMDCAINGYDDDVWSEAERSHPDAIQYKELVGESCCICGRERTIGDPRYHTDAYDYHPKQARTGQPLGWYSGRDAQICPEDFTKLMGEQWMSSIQELGAT